MENPRELSRRELGGGSFVRVEAIDWVDADGISRVWESAERTNQIPAVGMIARFNPSGDILLIRQYRPPAKGYVIEFPAGLVEPGEEPDVAALRELKEETGFTGTVSFLGPPTFSSPGLGGEQVHIAAVEICENDPENRSPVPNPDAGEHIEVFRLHPKQIIKFLQERFAAGDAFDSKVAAFLCGLYHNRAEEMEFKNVIAKHSGL